MSDLVGQFEKKTGYRFSDPSLLRDALTHRSAASKNNERLEFLGDAVLNFLTAAELYRRHPNATEGQLSRLRAYLVKGETLAELARKLDMGEHLRLGTGELKSGGFRRTSILADAFEALVGAIYLDGGLEACRHTVTHLLAGPLSRSSPEVAHKDPKTQLQELLQARRLSRPEYTVVTTEGRAHQQTFVVECRVELLEQPTRGVGSSRRKAEQEAARMALDRLSDA